MNLLAIDIGGTEIKSACLNEHGQIQQTFTNQATQVSQYDNTIVEQCIALIEQVNADTTLDGIAIATAGVVNPISGEVVYAGATIPGYSNTPLAAQISARCQLPCYVENDVNAMALGEHWLGAGKKSHSGLYLTIGTGIGGAVILQDKLWHGHNFSAGEIGYFPSHNGKVLQQCASTRALLEDYYLRSGERVNGKILFTRAKAQQEDALAALDKFSNSLVQGLLPAVYLLAPEIIVIGGGIAAQKTILEPLIEQKLRDRIQDVQFLPNTVCCAQLGNNAGMIGAVANFLTRSLYR